MTVVAEHAPSTLKVLTAEQREAYVRDGFLFLPGLIDDETVDRLNAVTNAFVELSRPMTKSNKQFDLEPDHSAEEPRIRRLNSPVEFHPVYWEFVVSDVVLDVVEDLIGPDIKYHHGKLNFKAPRGGEEVRWHQDITFWPHTNYSPLTIGIFLEDVTADMGNVGFLPGSHEWDLFDQYDGDQWIGCLSEADEATLPLDTAVFPTGPKGSITVHNCRTVHGSAPNSSDVMRPLLLQTYAAAHAFTYTSLVSSLAHSDTIVRGKPARWALHDPRPCLVGPEKSRTIFEVQQREK